MAKLQRGESECELEKAVRVSVEMSDSSEDEGPEEVAFEESRSAALKSEEEKLQAAKREKELLKEKRRKRQQFFQEQKKKRLLSDTLLEEFDTVPQKQKKLSDDRDEEKDKKQQKLTKSKKKKASRSLQGNCSVMRLKDESADSSMQQSAMDFIQARLYGSGTLRTTNAELLSLEKKRGVKKGAAVQFVNKKWGAEQKAKAEKSNKRFIHRQKLITT
ncbi:nucleolar protein 7 [Astyanax mexicanus]|uniref:Nucleolar protein 7 n=1 Tax=Astyanax mexicanus TaxID=7994 RepID=A0A8T2LR78_ASTMX|nr:nucleolar protein 7 [Astyanax mexicanus]